MNSPILDVKPLGNPPWETFDPFLFCVHHLDNYPSGNAKMGPDASLAGRQMGQDFARKDGWSMYHGEVVPGFPSHPHRGFETITLARNGFIDHSDSLGATARFGHGDVQWMTAGKGIQHSEMFPLVHAEKPNPTELFQIWLNLPAHDKMVDPYFTMLWADQIPTFKFSDAVGVTHVVSVCGSLDGSPGPQPPPNSWASKPGADVAIMTIKMSPNARWTVPSAPAGVNRALYFFSGGSLKMADRSLQAGVRALIEPTSPITLVNGDQESELLLLQGRPIREPVAHYGPFVMNTREELEVAFSDYRKTRFGGWPWKSTDPVHERGSKRFAVHADGRREDPTS